MCGNDKDNLQTKLKVYKYVGMVTILYACETWAVYCRLARKLNKFHINCLRRLLRNAWQDMIPNTEARATKHSYSAKESSTSMGWPCCQNKSDERPPKRLLYGELSEGMRSTGGQRKRYILRLILPNGL